MEHQYGFRLKNTIAEVQQGLMTEPLIHIRAGRNILLYQAEQNRLAMLRSFETELNGLKIVACNGAQFNSNSFDSIYNPEFHDAMMPFNYDGQANIWNFSLYTTKDVDILSIAKSFGGGGHLRACGFQLTPDKIYFTEKGFEIVKPTIVTYKTVEIPPPPVEESIQQNTNKDLNLLGDDSDLDGIGKIEEPKKVVSKTTSKGKLNGSKK